MNTKSIPALTPISRLSLKTIATNTDTKYLKSNYNAFDSKIHCDVENKQLPNLDKNTLVLGDNNYNSMNLQKHGMKNKTAMGISNGRNSMEISTNNKNESTVDLNNRYSDNNNLDISVISSDNDTKDQDVIAVPDSTTQVIKAVQQFNIGEDVFVQQKDKRYFLGTIIEVDPARDRCLVKFGDNTESWSNAKELALAHLSSRGPLCIVCKSTANKESDKIIVCDKCDRGYHQKCHSPKVLNANGVWNCRRCMDQIHHMRKMENKSLRRNSSAVEIVENPIMNVTTTSQNHLSYDLSALAWDDYHRTNKEQIYCYCGANGDWFKQMLQCARCRQWFHERCIGCLQYPVYNGDRFYVFVCLHCNFGMEFVRRLEMKWVDIVHLLLYNLTSYKQIKYYDLDDILVPYATDNWHALQVPPQLKDISRQDLRAEILSTLNHYKDRFRCGREIKKKVSIWGLRVRQPPLAPCVTIGFSGIVTDGVLRDSWKGNKKLQFLNPVSIVRPQNSISRSNSYPGTDYGISSQPQKTPPQNMIVPLDSEMLEKMRGQLLNEQELSDSDSVSSLESHEEDDTNIKCIEMDYTGDGFVKKTPKTQSKNDDLKIMLKIDCSDTLTGSKKRKNLRKMDKMKVVCPPTPPTSVSAPPTPPACNFTNSADMNYPDCESKDSDSVVVKTVYDNLKAEFKNDLCDSSDDTSSRCTLDSIIPPPKDFQGKNNPFHSMPKSELEGKKGKNGRRGKKLEEKSSKLEGKVGARTLKRKLSEKDVLEGERVDAKRRRFRSRNSLPEMSTASKTASYTPLLSGEVKDWIPQRSLRSSLNNTNLPSTTNSTPISNCVDYALNGRRLRQRQDITYAENGRRNSTNKSNGNNIPINTSPISTSTKVTDVCITDLKSSVNMYFGGMNRILSGEKFVVQGKRINSDGKVQYLIEWEGGPS